MNEMNIAGVGCTYKNGSLLNGQENELIVFRGYRKLKKLKPIEGEEYFKNLAEKSGWTVVYDFDWCDKVYEVYDKSSFKSIDEKNKTCILKEDARYCDKEYKTNIVVWAAYKNSQILMKMILKAVPLITNQRKNINIAKL